MPALADEHNERFLFPIASPPISGANGSLWEVELWYRNDSGIPAELGPSVDSAPVRTMGITLPYCACAAFSFTSIAAPRMVRVEPADPRRVAERRDVGHRAACDFFVAPLTLLNVPTDSGFRAALRIYEAALGGAGRVRVTVHPNAGDAVLGTFDADLLVEGVPAFSPGFAQLLSLRDAFPAIGASERVRIRIEPLTPGAR